MKKFNKSCLGIFEIVSANYLIKNNLKKKTNLLEKFFIS